MKHAAVFSFTDGGEALAGKVAAGLERDGFTVEICPRGRVMEQAARQFARADALVFIGACGIAVRAVAPHVASKVSDPAVVVMDEKGKHVISLLSGHIGGANDLARRIAGICGGEAVITTATDVNRRFSVDTWAAEKGIAISSMEAARRFAADILKRDLPVLTDFPVEGVLPEGVFDGREGETGAWITCSKEDGPFDTTLRLIPRLLHIGVGCRRGTPHEKIEAAVTDVFAEAGIDERAVNAVASIDVKKDEEGLLAFCRERGLPLRLFSAEELSEVPGEFTSSEFVKKTVGVDNVCERSAVRSAGPDAELLIKKKALEGVTVAVAREKWSVSFE